MKNALCIIPARGGSKRIPRKNIRPFLGKPIIAYSIEVALKSGMFDEVIVSTDDEEIADVARQYGASVPFMRSSENADDHATLADVVDEVLGHYRGKFKYACCILPTAPLVSVDNLLAGFELLQNENCDIVYPIVRFAFPIQRAFRSENGKLSWFYPQFENTRSQDLEPAFHDSGQFYWMKTKTGMRSTNRFGMEISEMEEQDIDTEMDWSLAELKFELLKRQKD